MKCPGVEAQSKHWPSWTASAIAALFSIGFSGCGHEQKPDSVKTATPLKHVIVIFQENRSFDHYFGVYPKGNGGFKYGPDTPAVNGIPAGVIQKTSTGEEVTPYATTRTRTLDVQHTYAAMVVEYNNKKMDSYAEIGSPLALTYYDERSPVVAYWKLAQEFTLCDNYFQSVFGPSTPEAFYLVCGHSLTDSGTADGHAIMNDIDPFYGPWGKGSDGSRRTIAQDFPTIADSLAQRGIPWGWFQEGYTTNSEEAGRLYEAHHNPFQYMKRWHGSPNLHGMDEFIEGVANGNLPSVCYVKGAEGHDEHPGKSDLSNAIPWVEDVIERIRRSPAWGNSVVFLTWDESGGWYDHVPPAQVSGKPPSIKNIIKNFRGETVMLDPPSGYGPRVPCLVISPYARKNYVCHALSDHTSILRFIEQNFYLKALGKRRPETSNLMDAFDFKSKK